MSAYQVWPLVVDDNGVCSVPDAVLAMIYHRICDDGKLDALFYDGACRDMLGWMQFIKSRDRLVVIIYDDTPVIHCIAWLSQYERGMPFGHFCMLGKLRKDVGPTVMEYWRGFDFPVILGLTPENNERAIRFIKMVGFRVLCTVPQACFVAGHGGVRRTGGVLSCYEYTSTVRLEASRNDGGQLWAGKAAGVA